MPKLTRGRSLRSSFLLAIVVAYAIIATLTFFAFSRSAGRISERYASRYCASQSGLETEKILSLVDRELALSLKIADDPELRAWMQAEGDASLRKAAFSELESYRRFLRDGAYFVALRKGNSYYARTPGTEGLVRTTLDPLKTGDRWFYNELAQGEDYVLNVDHDDLLGENRVWINVLVRDDSGSPIGIAGCGMDLTRFLGALVGKSEAGVTKVVVNAAGALQAYADKSMIAHNAEVHVEAGKVGIYGLLDGPSDREALRSALAAASRGASLNGGASTGETAPDQAPPAFPVNFRGTRMLCSIGALPELGWYSLVLVDPRSIIGPSDFLPIAMVVMASLLLVLACVIVVMNRLVIDPVRELTGAAGRVAAGAYDVSLPQDRLNEIGSLSASFNIMAGKVREYTAELEGKVEARTAELRDANERLEGAQRRMLDSIEYAKLIQDSIHPAESALRLGLGGHFAIVRERDIVGGDFFFYRPVADDFCLAVVDCTGHGVPGAFMTMLVKAQLDHVVDANPGAAPSAILGELDRLVRESLRAESETAHLENGLDIAFCRFRKGEGVIEFAGAGLPLFVLSLPDAGASSAEEPAVLEVPGDHVHLGFMAGRRERSLVDHRIEARPGSRFYLATDGVLDLPGGERRLGFGRGRLVGLLRGLGALPMEGQGAVALAALEKYRGDNPPRDDFTFVGFSVNRASEE